MPLPVIAAGTAMLVSAGISGLAQAFGIGKAAKEAKRQRKMGQDYLNKADSLRGSLGERPKMDMPQGQKDYVNLMSLYRRQEMADKSGREEIVRQEGATTRGAFANLSGADAAAGMLGEGAQRLRGLRQIGLEASQYGQQQNLAYAGAVQSNAPWQQQMWNNNNLAPWEIGQNQAQGYENAGLSFMGQGSDQGAAVGINGANMFNQFMHQQSMNPNSWMNNMGQQPPQVGYNNSYNPASVTGGMANPARPTYNPSPGTYDTIG